MTNISSNIRRDSTLVGLVGEYLAAQLLREHGGTVPDDESFGSQRRHYDLRLMDPGSARLRVSPATRRS